MVKKTPIQKREVNKMIDKLTSNFKNRHLKMEVIIPVEKGNKVSWSKAFLVNSFTMISLGFYKVNKKWDLVTIFLSFRTSTRKFSSLQHYFYLLGQLLCQFLLDSLTQSQLIGLSKMELTFQVAKNKNY